MQLARVVDVLEAGTLTAGQKLFREGDAANHFYIILEGKISLTQAQRGGEKRLATLVSGDYFGEEALARRGRRPVTATACEVTHMLRIDAAALKRLFHEIPLLKSNLQIAASTHRLVQSTRLEWLNPDEAVFLMARKHAYFLWEGLAGPLFAVLVSFTLMGLFYF
jgi:CRP-like cAMP-binding protein